MHLDKSLGGMTAENGQYTISGQIQIGQIDQDTLGVKNDPSFSIKSGVGIGHMGPGRGGIGGVYLTGSGSGHDDLTGHGLSEVEGNQTTMEHQGITNNSIGQVEGKKLYFNQTVTIQGGNRVYDTYMGQNKNDMSPVGHTVIPNTNSNASDSDRYGPLQAQIRVDGTVPGTTHLIGPVTVTPLQQGGANNLGSYGNDIPPNSPNVSQPNSQWSNRMPQNYGQYGQYSANVYPGVQNVADDVPGSYAQYKSNVPPGFQDFYEDPEYYYDDDYYYGWA